MAEIKDLLGQIYKGILPAVNECGFYPVYENGMDTNGANIKQEGDRYIMLFSGNEKSTMIEFANNKIALYGVNKEGEINAADYVQLALTLLDPAEANDKDVRYIVNDFTDTLVESFGTKIVKPVKSKLPAPVSKGQVKSGSLSYDPNTLANRFTSIFPQLREEYKANCEKYGSFLSEEFFINYGAPFVVDVIKKNNPSDMKRMFKLFNEVYDDGTNETQSLICVTILGSLKNDMELLANCTDYMSPELAGPVINVNKYLWSKDGKGARMKLDNPPLYKPKKKKKNNMMSTLGM